MNRPSSDTGLPDPALPGTLAASVETSVVCGDCAASSDRGDESERVPTTTAVQVQLLRSSAVGHRARAGPGERAVAPVACGRRHDAMRELGADALASMLGQQREVEHMDDRATASGAVHPPRGAAPGGLGVPRRVDRAGADSGSRSDRHPGAAGGAGDALARRPRRRRAARCRRRDRRATGRFSSPTPAPSDRATVGACPFSGWSCP